MAGAIVKPMMGRNRRGSDGELLEEDMAYKYRRILGAYLKEHRKAAGLTQEEVGKHMDMGISGVSAIELGRNSLSPEHYDVIVKLFGLKRTDFGEFVLRYTSPWTYDLLFGQADKKIKKELKVVPTRINTRRKATAPRME